MNLCLAVLVTKKLENIVQLPIAYEIEKLNLIFRSTQEAEEIPRPFVFYLNVGQSLLGRHRKFDQVLIANH